MTENMLLPKSVATRSERGCGENRIAVMRSSKHAHAPSHLLSNTDCAIESGAGGVHTTTVVHNSDNCQAHGQMPSNLNRAQMECMYGAVHSLIQ